MAGPLAIVACTLIVLHDFAFSGLVTNQHGDILSLVLPDYCYLGRSLAAGHIPAWDPHILGGLPFAADPQSGWMYLPAMLLFGALPCAAAIRWFIVLQPLLAGLGTYWFLRSEGLGRPAATLGGIALSLVIAASYIGLALPLAATVAWTALALAMASKCLRARTWPSRILWAVAVAVAWGQLAGAYLSVGLGLGTAALLIFLLARLGADVRAGRRSGRNALLLIALILTACPLVNLAYLLPRLEYLPRTILGHGYTGLSELLKQLGQKANSDAAAGGLGPPWPLGFAASPGSYLGAAVLTLAPAALWTRRFKALTVAAVVYAGALYVFALGAVQHWVAHHLSGWPLVDFYLHSVGRLRYGMVLPLAVLGAVGLEAWMDRRDARARFLMLVPGIIVWGLLPAVTRVPDVYSPVLLCGAAAALAALAVVSARPRAAMLVPIVLSVELCMGGLLGQRTPYVHNGLGIFNAPSGTFPGLERPTIDAAAYLRPGPIARTLERRGGRFLAYEPALLRLSGYVRYQRPAFWGFPVANRAMLFGIEDVQGYNSVQPTRYWRYANAGRPDHVQYNVTVLRHPTPAQMDLLDVRWVVGREAHPPPGAGAPIATEGRWAMYPSGAGGTMATLLTQWRGATEELAFRDTTRQTFDPEGMAVVEGDPGIAHAPERAASPQRLRNLEPQSARIDVHAPAPGILLVRIPYDPDWHATLDGRAVAVLPADYVMMGVPVPAGRHVVELAYDDPWIGYGLLGSAVALLALGGAAVWLRSRTREPDHRALDPGPPSD